MSMLTKQPSTQNRTNAVIEALGDSTVIEIIADEDKTFNVHQNLACKFSGYFRGMTRNEFQETLSKKVDWSGEDAEDPNLVRLFIAWLYTGKIDLTNHSVSLKPAEMPFEYDDESKSNGASNEHGKAGGDAPTEKSGKVITSDKGQAKKYGDHHDRNTALLKLWNFADRFDIPDLQDDCINALHLLGYHQPNAGFRWRALLWAWDQSTKASKIRAYIVEWICATPGRDMNRNGVLLPNALSMAIIRRYRTGMADCNKGEGNKLWAELDICQFHCHANDKVCKLKSARGVPVEKAQSSDLHWEQGSVKKDKVGKRS